MNYEDTHQCPHSSLTTTSHQVQKLKVVVVHSFTELSWLRMAVLLSNCSSKCGENIPRPLSQCTMGDLGASALERCYMLHSPYVTKGKMILYGHISVR